MRHLVSFVAGALFGLGLVVSGMTMPSKVSGFLDVSTWDPSLALVMVAAIVVHFVGRRLVLRARAPRFRAAFDEPKSSAIDLRLVAGSAIFGVGWALAGYCPGPAIVAAGSGAAALVFTGAMLVGMLLHRAWRGVTLRGMGSVAQPDG